MGHTYADLNAAGTTPADRDTLSRQHRNGTSSLEHSSRSHAGNGSEAHCLFSRACTATRTSSCVTCLKLESTQTVNAKLGAGSQRMDIGDFLVKETVEIPVLMSSLPCDQHTSPE